MIAIPAGAGVSILSHPIAVGGAGYPAGPSTSVCRGGRMRPPLPESSAR
jgi:hypothetical protein